MNTTANEQGWTARIDEQSGTVRPRRWAAVLALFAAAAAGAGCGVDSADESVLDETDEVIGEAEQEITIGNGGFESPALPTNTDWFTHPQGTKLGAWTVASGNVDIVDGGPQGWLAASGAQSLDLVGTVPGKITQDLSTIPGQTYTVKFMLAGNPNLGPFVYSMRVKAGAAQADHSFNTANSTKTLMGWVQKTFNFTATASTTTLSFEALNQFSSAGAALDAVTVTTVSPALSNGSFETAAVNPGAGTLVLAANSTQVSGWTVGTGGVTYAGTLWKAGDGSRSIELNTTVAGSIRKTISTVVGQTYTVSFKMAGDPSVAGDKKLTVSAAGVSSQYTFNTTGKTKTDMGWVGRTFTFKATSTSTVLTFTSNTPGSAGPVIDAVFIRALN